MFGRLFHFQVKGLWTEIIYLLDKLIHGRTETFKACNSGIYENKDPRS